MWEGIRVASLRLVVEDFVSDEKIFSSFIAKSFHAEHSSVG